MVWLKMNTVWLIVLGATTSLAGENADDFLRFLEARDESIVSYEIKLRQVHFDIELDKYEAFKKSIEQLAQREAGDLSPSRRAEQLVRTWAEKARWLERHIMQCVERFKETLVFDSGGTDIKSYDGRLYYDYSDRNRQLDIYARIPNVKHASLGDVGLSTKGLRKSGRLLSFERDEEGVRCVFSFSDDNSRTTTQKYDLSYSLCHSQFRLSEQIQIYNHYLFHENIDGYSVPRITININRYGHRNECSIYVYVIEDVRLNCPLTSEDFSLGELPAKTLVVDYRFEPSVQWRYGEYRQAAANPDVVHTERCKPEGMIQFLKNTSSDRKAFSRRDSRIGRKAPPLHIREWLVKPPGIDKWPPGRFTVLEFWNIWCGPCIAAIPKNNELAEWVTNKGGLFLSIHSATEESSKVRDFLENHDVRYTVGLDTAGGQRAYWGSQTFSEYGINGIPSYVTIAKNGRVLSYKDLKTQRLQELSASEPDDIAQLATSRKDVRRPTSIPNGWLAASLEPNSQIQGRFFVFRAETPALRLKLSGTTDRTVKSEWSRHTAKGQTVHEVLLTAKAPDWGQTLKGYVALVAEYGETEELLTIPYELASKSLAEYVSPIIWFGPVRKGDTVTRKIMLQCDPQQKVKVNTVSIPSNLQLQIHDRWQRSNDILVECVFCSEEPGLQQGAAELLAFDSEGNEQPLNLYYCALALP
ncbi:MAG: TlpA family protein disulfide reductase [Desulfobacteraceae bacterium]|nr:TlpA family protein disulfide reductase [Desulfobacteraceae bacterium]